MSKSEKSSKCVAIRLLALYSGFLLSVGGIITSCTSRASSNGFDTWFRQSTAADQYAQRSNSQTEVGNAATSASVPTGKPAGDATLIPDDIQYTVISESTIPGIKRSADVRLNKRVTERVLRAIAMKLKGRDTHTYQRTFIVYYLPGTRLGTGAWATTHFDPDLEVRIMGSTVEEDRTLREKAVEPAPHDRSIVGKWMDNTPYGSGIITIYRKDGRTYYEKQLATGDPLTREVTDIKTAAGRRFDLLEARASGDYWLLDDSGNLQVLDRMGPISTFKPVKQ